MSLSDSCSNLSDDDVLNDVDSLDAFFNQQAEAALAKKRPLDATAQLDIVPPKRKAQGKDKAKDKSEDKSEGEKSEKPAKGDKPIGKKLGGNKAAAARAAAPAAAAAAPPAVRAGRAGRGGRVATAAPARAAKDRNVQIDAVKRVMPTLQRLEVFDIAVQAAVPQGPLLSTVSAGEWKGIGVSLSVQLLISFSSYFPIRIWSVNS